MGRLGDLLEVLHGGEAPRFRTLTCEYRVWRHTARTQIAFRAHAEQADGGGSYHVGRRPLPDESMDRFRLWLEQPDRVREEWSGDERGERLGIRDGARWWTYDPAHGAMSSEGGRNVSAGIGEQLKGLLEPAPLLSLLRFEPTGEGQRLGRPTLRARARPRELRRRLAFELRTLGLGADEYLLEVDAERGVLLHVEARREGLPFQVQEAVRVVFDAPIAPETFVFEPPPGEEVMPAGAMPRPRQVSLAEATREAPFTVLAPERVPRGWELHVTVHEGLARPRIRPSVTLSYSSREGAEDLNVSQSPAATAHPWADGGDLPLTTPVERDGIALLVRDRDRDWPQAQLQRELLGTRVTLTSRSLGAEQLIAYALGLRPYAGEE
jgi:hypothetical protein